jgi:chromosome segregation ATPase
MSKGNPQHKGGRGRLAAVGSEPDGADALAREVTILGDALRGIGAVNGSDGGDAAMTGELLRATLANLNARLAAVERRVRELGSDEAAPERRAHTVEAELIAGLRQEAAALQGRLRGQVAETEASLARRQRRQELKLARQERDRKLAEAERRVSERSEEALEAIARESAAAEERLRALRLEAGREQAAIVDTAGVLEERIRGLLDSEKSLADLVERTAKASERAASADARVRDAQRRVERLERDLSG